MKYAIASDGEGPMTVTALDNGLVMIADRNHPHFAKIVERALDFEKRDTLFTVPEDEVTSFRALFDASVAIEEMFRLTDRVYLQGTTLYFDGNAVESVLTNHVIRALSDNLGKDSYMPFIRFWERVQDNPTEHSRENLMRWLMAAEFTVTDEGFIVGYKGVNEKLKSLHSGPGIVNGVAKNGHLKNKPGNVIEMAREDVTHDPYNTCSVGLHVGTWNYAEGFGTKVVEVWVDPVDVVSVPNDANGQKMRVCKYTVKRVLNEGYSFAVLKTEPPVSVSPVEYDPEDCVALCVECGDAVTSEVDLCEWCANACFECGNQIEACNCDDECDEEEDPEPVAESEPEAPRTSWFRRS